MGEEMGKLGTSVDGLFGCFAIYDGDGVKSN